MTPAARPYFAATRAACFASSRSVSRMFLTMFACSGDNASGFAASRGST